MNRRWDSSAIINDQPTKLKDVIEGAEFHKLIEELMDLQKRKPFKMLRDARQELLEKASPK